MGAAAENARLARIEIFPVKSLDGLPLSEAAITSGGILEGDRAFAIFDGEGKVVNGKRTPRIHDLRCAYDDAATEVRLWSDDGAHAGQFPLAAGARLHRWLSDFFGFAVSLRHEPIRGFPDDPEAYGPTIVSEASLRAVQDWYPGLALQNVRRRFRTNLELEGGAPFCEDSLYGAPGELTPFLVGEVAFRGHNPCQRCVVPTRDPDSGMAIRGFQKSFAQLRQESLPPWANRQRFNHFYRFAVNTSVPPTEAGKRLRVGDVVRLDRPTENQGVA